MPSHPFKRRTKIVATIGPATATPETLRPLLAAGADVLRVNLSHGTPEDHRRLVRAARSASEAASVPAGVLFDLRGRKMRVGAVPGGSREVRPGETVSLTDGEEDGESIPLRVPGLAGILRPGQRLLVDDGKIELAVVWARDGRIAARAERGGVLKSGKGLNVPGLLPRGRYLGREDLLSLHAAASLEVDFLALSFVRGGDDVLEVRRRVRRLAPAGIPLIAKIENLHAIRRVEEIASVADGLMVARGDLGVELPPEQVPPVQRRLIDLANRTGKIVITATQMLESMIESPTPTRAEVSDVAHAVFDGTDAVMLSAETAVGKHPAEAVAMMAAACREAEASPWRKRIPYEPDPKEDAFPFALARAACFAAEEANADAIVPFTVSGRTAREISRQRPPLPILAFSPEPSTIRALALQSGVRPLHLEEAEDVPSLLAAGERALLEGRLLPRGAAVVFVAGTGLVAGAANLLRFHRLGEPL